MSLSLAVILSAEDAFVANLLFCHYQIRCSHWCFFLHFSVATVAVEFQMKQMAVGRPFLAQTASSVVRRYLPSHSKV